MTIELLLQRIKTQFPNMKVREAFSIRADILSNLMRFGGSARRLIKIGTDLEETLSVELDIDSMELFILTNYKNKSSEISSLEYVRFTIELEMLIATSSPLLSLTK